MQLCIVLKKVRWNFRPCAPIFRASIAATKPVWGQGLDSDSIRRLQAVRPNFVQSHHYTYKQLRLDTGDMDRVKRAWEYIYSHGCIGKKSPF
jgi:hypothetical protein